MRQRLYSFLTETTRRSALNARHQLQGKDDWMLLSFQVSVVTKIVPSPDWFVGLSSVELCNNGAFIKSHVEEVCTFKLLSTTIDDFQMAFK